MSEITITAKHDGFRRCGVTHRDKPVTFPDGYFSAEQIALLKAEPQLVVYEGRPVSPDETAAELCQLRADNAALREQTEGLTKETSALKAQVETLTTEKGALQSQVDALSVDKAALQAQLTELSAATAKGGSK